MILFLLDWQLTLFLYTPLVVLFALVYRFERRIGKAWEIVEEEMGRLTTAVQENISGARVVKAFAREKLEATKA